LSARTPPSSTCRGSSASSPGGRRPAAAARWRAAPGAGGGRRRRVEAARPRVVDPVEAAVPPAGRARGTCGGSRTPPACRRGASASRGTARAPVGVQGWSLSQPGSIGRPRWYSSRAAHPSSPVVVPPSRPASRSKIPSAARRAGRLAPGPPSTPARRPCRSRSSRWTPSPTAPSPATPPRCACWTARDGWMQAGGGGDEPVGDRLPPSPGRRMAAALVHPAGGGGALRPRHPGRRARALGGGPAGGRTQAARFHTASGVLTAMRDGEWIRMDFPATPAERPRSPRRGSRRRWGPSRCTWAAASGTCWWRWRARPCSAPCAPGLRPRCGRWRRAG
jgi:hypothetical protein